MEAPIPSPKEIGAPLVHVTFSTERFSQSLARLRRSAKKVGVKDVRIYRPDHHAVRLAAEQNPEIMLCNGDYPLLVVG